MTENTDTQMQTIENANLGDIRPGDHLTWTRTKVLGGVTSTQSYEGIAHHHDGDGDWLTKDDVWITDGEGEGFTLTIRRPIQELPKWSSTVIIPNDGYAFIEAIWGGSTWQAREAVLDGDGKWHGLWRRVGGPAVIGCVTEKNINSHTWKVEEK